MVWGGSGNLTLTMNGTSKTINHSGKGWATFSPFSTVLGVGSHSWDLTSAGSHLLGPNKGWGGWDAPDGQAWLYDGSSWGYWPGWSAPDQLMTHQWYLDGLTI